MVEAKYFGELSQPEHFRYFSLLGRNYVAGKMKHSISTSYLIDFEDGGRSFIAKTKARKADPSLEDTEDISSNKTNEISFQIVKNINTAVKTNSAFQSTTATSEDCITVSSPSNPNPDVLPETIVLQKYLISIRCIKPFVHTKTRCCYSANRLCY